MRSAPSGAAVSGGSPCSQPRGSGCFPPETGRGRAPAPRTPSPLLPASPARTAPPSAQETAPRSVMFSFVQNNCRARASSRAGKLESCEENTQGARDSTKRRVSPGFVLLLQNGESSPQTSPARGQGAAGPWGHARSRVALSLPGRASRRRRAPCGFYKARGEPCTGPRTTCSRRVV